MDAAIIAVGCAGGRMVNRIIEWDRIKAEYLAINTDRRELDACQVSRKILIGEQRFQGHGGAKPHVIMEESAAALDAIRQACAGPESVIIVAGLGGGTGTGIVPLWSRGSRSDRAAKQRRWDKAFAVGRPGRLGLCAGGAEDAGGRGSTRDGAAGGAAAG